MPRSRLLPLALLLGAASPLAVAFAGTLEPTAIVRDFDGDGRDESLDVRDLDCPTTTPTGCGAAPTRRLQVSVTETCKEAQHVIDILPRPEEFVDQMQVREVDGDFSRREVVVSGFTGASGRVGSGRVARLGADADGCATARSLFAFGPSKARTPKPKGASSHQVGTLRLLSLRSGPKYSGKELRYTESWFKRTDADCCPTWTSSIDLRFDATTDRYVKFASRIRRIGRPR